MPLWVRPLGHSCCRRRNFVKVENRILWVDCMNNDDGRNGVIINVIFVQCEDPNLNTIQENKSAFALRIAHTL